MRGPWIAWLIACTLLPALPFLLIGKKGLDDGGPLIPLAVLMAIVFMIASVIIGTVSFFAACVGLGEPINFH